LINVNDLAAPADGLTELATLGGDSDPSGMIRSTPQGLTGGMAGAHRFVGHFPRLRSAIS
jgi:hypothetical protein